MVKRESDGEISIMMTTTEQSSFLTPAYSRTSSLHNSRRGSSNEIRDLVVSIQNLVN